MKHIFFFIALAGIISSCGNMNNANNNASAEKEAKNKQRVQAFYDKVFNAHNPAMIDSFCAADFKEHQIDPHYPATIEGLKKSFADLFAGFPDLNSKSNFMIAHGDTVVVHFTMTGTNTGPMMGMQPTNKKMNVDGVDIVRISNGMAVEHWGYVEEMKMMTQMGMMPDMGAGMDTSKGKMMDDKKMMDTKKK